MNSFHQTVLSIPALVLALIFFAMILGLNWLGYRTRKRVHRLHPEKEIAPGASEGALLGLMALLLAFSFGMVSTKFENRRQNIIEEANIINTAILRCDLYPDSIRQLIRPDMKQYLEARINYFDAGGSPGENKINVSVEEAEKSFKKIWELNAGLRNDPANRLLADQMAPVLISMKNIAATREALRVAAVPLLIIIILLLLVLSSSFIIGYGIKPSNRNPVLSLFFAIMTSAVLFLILELSRPRKGLINLGTAQQNMIDLRKNFE